MAAFLPDAWIVDVIIALVAVEGQSIMMVWRALTPRRPYRNANSGQFVVQRSPPSLALSSAITGGLSSPCLSNLGETLVKLHVADLTSRWEAASTARSKGSPMVTKTGIAL